MVGDHVTKRLSDGRNIIRALQGRGKAEANMVRTMKFILLYLIQKSDLPSPYGKPEGLAHD